jgi:dienelactone hydrolase
MMHKVKILPRVGALCSIALALVTAACAFPTTANGIHTLANSQIDPKISDPSKVSYAGYDPQVTQNGLLLVFLGGTGSAPSGYRLFSKEALKAGYHVIDLDYLDGTTVGSICRDDLSCYGGVRQEIVTGTDSSSLVNVSPSDSILNRLSKALAYLASNYPAEGWSSYLSSAQIKWPSIVISGFSQGAGHALWIAKHYVTKGALLFSGPVDGRIDSPSQSASWISDSTAWATPRSSMHFFVSTKDGYYSGIHANLMTLGFDPATVGISVDNGPPSISGHPLLLASAIATNAHPSVVEDDATPMKSDGTAVYAPVWDYLLRSW